MDDPWAFHGDEDSDEGQAIAERHPGQVVEGRRIVEESPVAKTLNSVDLERLKVSELKELARQRSLPVSGTKPILIARLRGEEPPPSATSAGTKRKPAPRAKSTPGEPRAKRKVALYSDDDEMDGSSSSSSDDDAPRLLAMTTGVSESTSSDESDRDECIIA